MKEISNELPDELWELILSRVNWKSPSLVCKQFQSITNQFPHKLKAKTVDFYSNANESLLKSLKRFRNLTEIELFHVGDKFDINRPIWKIASSGLDLRSLCFNRFPMSPSAESFSRLGSAMKNLKILRCEKFISLRDTDLVHIADAFPHLEELDIRYPKNEFVPRSKYPELSTHEVTDAGIEAISYKLQWLRRINISGNRGCSDRSLIALSSNCVLLEEIKCYSCVFHGYGISFAARHRPNLISVETDVLY